MMRFKHSPKLLCPASLGEDPIEPSPHRPSPSPAPSPARSPPPSLADPGPHPRPLRGREADVPVDGGGAVRAFWLSRVRDGLRGGRTCPDLFAGGGSPLSLAPQQRPPQPAPGDSDPRRGGGAPLAALRSPGPAAGGREQSRWRAAAGGAHPPTGRRQARTGRWPYWAGTRRRCRPRRASSAWGGGEWFGWPPTSRSIERTGLSVPRRAPSTRPQAHLGHCRPITARTRMASRR